MKYFLVTSMPKSGSTWLQRIFAAHPDMHCRVEDQFTKFWSDFKLLVSNYNSLIELRDRERDHQGVDRLNATDTIDLFYSMVLIALKKAPNGSTWSGVKDLSLSANGFLSMLPEDSRVVTIVRDPRDIAVSAWAHGRRIKTDGEERDPNPQTSFVLEIASYWKKQIRLSEAAKNNFPGRATDVRYEDLSSDFEATATRLFSFFDVARDPETIDAIRKATAFENLSGGRRPGEEDLTSFFRSGRWGAWRETLTTPQILKVDQVCGEDLVAYGYPRNRND